MQKISEPKNRAFSSALGRSNRCEASGVAGSVRSAKAIASTPTGTLMANSIGQVATASTPAATLGPTAVLTPTTMALKPTPRPSWRAG